ncbi:hypothetical protein V6259_12735 [Marinomonas sp. TI.3.20]|uniref:hypothetical protein n=1 Tax=Marinomonas sp. TI.3.20 TaxID=3121296 RepID=UPI00311DB629
MIINTKCRSCGANVSYEANTEHMSCEYCHHTIDIENADSNDRANDELNLDEYINKLQDSTEQVELHVIRCNGCGATTELGANKLSGVCSFCDAPLVVEQARSHSMIKPAGLLPFGISEETATTNFKSWVSKLWFAPSELKIKATKLESFNGVYLPFWTYDCGITSHYTGRQGTYYYVTVNSKDSDGNNTTSQQRRTRWRSVTGSVSKDFDDILIPATNSVSQKKLNALQPWHLEELVDYKDMYISGYQCECYDKDLKTGFQEAKVIIGDAVDLKIKRDIGGDEQQVSSVQTHYLNPKFKHILLPVWVSAYRYKNKVYQVLVNARTGEVQAERPWSWFKIASLIGMVAVGIGAGMFWYSMHNG